ncbi:Atrial natriuretic peptide receptor 1 [Mizuhopecten yessoensis]|uniref:Guanylate cyclase n=3 Tax=Mizuhopecten yessoensis TaxID=6573 RepID=A0A210QPN5_MIZYE|nr:Atrial natriuretic peptide receptor 1 [Mizuhopecten yessoensis]
MSIPPLSALGGILTFFMFGLKWFRLVLISASDAVSKGYADAIVATLQSPHDNLGVYIAHHYSEVNWNMTEAEVDAMFQAIKDESRIIVMVVPETDLRRYMLRAAALSMTAGDYQFVFVKTTLPSESDFQRLATTSIWQKGDGHDAAAKQAFRNVLYVVFGNTHDDIGGWHQLAKEAAARVYPAGSSNMPDLYEPDKYSIYLHDAILLYAKVLNTTYVPTPTRPLSGAVIAKTTSSISFNGLSGLVLMSVHADRYPGVAIYDLIENDTFAEAAHLHYDLVNGKPESDSLVGIFRWGDGRTNQEYIPPDVPVCGFHGELCIEETASQVGLYVGLSVGMVGLLFVLLLIFRFWRREREINNMGWKIPFNALDFEAGKRNRSLTNFSNRLNKSTKSLGTDRQTEYTYGQTTLTDSFSEAIQKQEHSSVAIARFKRSVVAVKHIRKKKIATTDRTLLKEMKMLLDLKHNNVTTLRGVCTDPGHICVLWEYCAKGSLQEILDNDDIKLDTMFKLSLAIDICKGLEYIHRSELRFHGGLQSSTCVVDSRWTCKLTDFGPRYLMNGAELDPNESEEHRYRALFWTAPEFLKKALTKRMRVGSPAGDIYSFGVVAMEIVTREPPYQTMDLTAEEIIRNVLIPKDGLLCRPKFSALSDSFPAAKQIGGIQRLVERCWNEDSSFRPTAKTVLKVLNKINPYKKANVIENMITMMEKYSNQLEDLVDERTAQLEEEKRKTESLLYRMLPRKIAEQLRIGMPVQAEAFEMVTIYFSDIVGFTSIAAASTPLQIVGLLNALYTVFDDTIKHFDVYKVETIGDAYMIVSGLPEKNGNKHVTEMASVSIALLNVVRHFKIPHKPTAQLEIRIGLHSGPVVAGVVGLTMPRYCLFGDTVNTASRMESNGQALKIHISNVTNGLLKEDDRFKISERGEMDIKGKGKMTTYWLDGFESEEDFRTLTRKANSIDIDLQSASTLDIGHTNLSPEADQEPEYKTKPFKTPQLPSAFDIQKQNSALSDIFDPADDFDPEEY